MRNDIFIDMKNGLWYDPSSVLRSNEMGRPPGSKNFNRPGAVPGTMYSDWRVIREVASPSKDRRVLCECTLCGKQAENYLNNLKRGRNCDCATRSQRNYKHGYATKGATHPMYTSWSQMLQRCYNENNPTYRSYGAKGIKVCDSWRIFTGFLVDMEAGWEPGLALGRIDHSKDYGPSNCKWVTIDESRSDRNRGE